MSVIDDLENSIDIVDLVWKYTKLKKAGANYKALCPFPGHSEKTPSFVVSPSKQLGYCFGCHKWWWALKFVMDMENCEFKESVEILWNLTWKKVEGFNINPEAMKLKKSIYGLYKDASSYYKLALERHPDIKQYLLARDMSEETIAKFHFGYADSGSWLYSYLKEKWYEDNIISGSNIFLDIRTKKDKFINRIIFPIQNLRGDFVAFAGRVIDKWEPKYLNSPASKIYDKSSILYGLYGARSAITKQDYVIITEWYMDTIALQENGFPNTVAVSGTALTEKQLQILKRLTRKIYLCFDGDKAGQNATRLSLELMKNKWFEVKIIMLKWGKDPDEIIKSGKDFWKMITWALSPIGYYIETSNFDTNSIDEKKKLLVEALSILKSYSDNIEKNTYLKEISKKLDIDIQIIYDEFNKIRFKRERKQMQVDKSLAPSPEDMAIAYILHNNALAPWFYDGLVFKEEISENFRKAIDNPDSYLSTLDLERKEKLRWLSLKIEERETGENTQTQEKTIEKLIKKINTDTYKSLTERLKSEMKAWDIKAFEKYSVTVKKAKQHNIK